MEEKLRDDEAMYKFLTCQDRVETNEPIAEADTAVVKISDIQKQTKKLGK